DVDIRKVERPVGLHPGDVYLLHHGVFLQAPGEHQPLHSFPTRRSSDLARQLIRDVLAAWQRLDILVNNAGVWEEDEASRGDLATDRKSTRLNSSHLVISYAVFCLKKKTDAPTHTLKYLMTPAAAVEDLL